ncbi:MAG: RNA polymerase factor sigma-54 [Megasphaera sp.]|jgi:RNA polymerase sigma-54 factor|nr:RNA polymerase factor sigma-54 [Megasphaera sp.]MCH4188119.1 RNA polymerase factor sigma-54 [Megasphaera sp.]MCH4217957.1 RNA polymerase factor sigma-54 [Megasphaera sp.]
MNMKPELTQDQQQHMSAAQIQSLHILAMPADALQELLQKESEENPFMEYQPSSSAGGAEEYLNFVAAPEKDTVKNFILEQLNPQQFSKPHWALLSYLAACVDDSGFLTITEQDLTAKFPLPPGLFASCLQTLQGLHPVGICAYDIRECLKLQLQHNHKLSPLLTTLIDDHLSDIAANNLNSLCHLLHSSKAEIMTAINMIKKLNPSPLKGLFEKTDTYVVPDVIIRLTPEGHETILNDSWVASYSLSDYYINMMQTATDPDVKSYFQQKYNRAYMLIHNIEQRRKTLITLTNAIWNWQYTYIQQHHVTRPMTLKNIADLTGLHISTISRSTKDKYVQTPWSTVSFKSLFQSPLLQKGKEGLCKNSIKKALRTLIDTERPDAPYSDLQLVELLQSRHAMTVSRRAIQKYRNALCIPNSYERKHS